MFLAAERGDLATLERLLAKDPSLVRSHYEYRTPLSFAVRANQLAAVELLLDHGDPLALGDPLELARDRGYREMEALLGRKLADRNLSSRGEAVAAAIRERNPAEVRRLLDVDPSLLRAGDRRSNQPIHWAVMTRQLDLVDELIGRGADLDARRDDGARPIHLTNGDYFYRGWRDVPKDVTVTPDQVYHHLVARGAVVDLGMAAAKGDLARVRELLDPDPALVNQVSEYGSYYIGCGAPLKNAAAGGHYEIVELMLARGADPNLPEEHIAPQGHALYTAVAHRHYDIARLLLEHGADPDAPVESSANVLWQAIASGERRFVELLARYGATWEYPMRLDGALGYQEIVSTGIRRSLKVLAAYEELALAEALLASNPSLADDPEALGYAAARGNEAFVRLLLRYRPDLAKRVTMARPRGLAELLFAGGMDPNRRTWLLRTPLHGFAAEGDLEAAALYLDHGADIHAREEEHCSTPLAHAARAGQAEMVEFLLRRGARPRLPDDPPWATPLAWADRRGDREIVQLLAAQSST